MPVVRYSSVSLLFGLLPWFFAELGKKAHVFENGDGFFNGDTGIGHNAGVLIGKLLPDGMVHAVFARFNGVVDDKLRGTVIYGAAQGGATDGAGHGVARCAVGGENLSSFKRFRFTDFTKFERFGNRAVAVLGGP